MRSRCLDDDETDRCVDDDEKEVKYKASAKSSTAWLDGLVRYVIFVGSLTLVVRRQELLMLK